MKKRIMYKMKRWDKYIYLIRCRCPRTVHRSRAAPTESRNASSSQNTASAFLYQKRMEEETSCCLLQKSKIMMIDKESCPSNVQRIELMYDCPKPLWSDRKLRSSIEPSMKEKKSKYRNKIDFWFLFTLLVSSDETCTLCSLSISITD